MKIFIAGAGAGKTTAMASNIVELRDEVEAHKIIFCITFTNNAAKCIESKLIKHYGCIPNDIKVSTIHSFLYRELISPYYFLLYGKKYKHISVSALPSKFIYKNAKIQRLEEENILHQTVIPERAKWIVCKKSTDNKAIKSKREVILNTFSEYCGAICIDEAQDIDSDMQKIFEKINDIGIKILMMGDPKQDLRGHGCLRNLAKKFENSVEYMSKCYRCPQKHLNLSNLLVSSKEQQDSVNKSNGVVTLYFETFISCNELIKSSSYDLMYISRKQGNFDTHKKENKDILSDLSEELEHILKPNYQDISELNFKMICYNYADNYIKNYMAKNDKKLAFKETFKGEKISKNNYGILMNALPDDSLTSSNNLVTVNSIESIKGQEGQDCLFILTTDLAAYLFGDKSEEKTTKNLLYVALTRSLDKLTIFITSEVEKNIQKIPLLIFLIDIVILITKLITLNI